jgi:hypothetical protein
MSKQDDLSAFKDIADRLENVKPDTLARERVRHRVIHTMQTGTIARTGVKKEGINVKKITWKPIAAFAAAFICLAGIYSTTSYAQNFVQSIKARFTVGNLSITQVDKELPPPPAPASPSSGRGSAEGRVELPTPPKLTVDDARSALGMNFPAPTWMPDYEFVNCVLHGKSMAEVQYRKGDETVNFLISKGGENGISTTDEVKTQTIDGKTVYFANGIVIWEDKGYTVELYSQRDFDADTLGKIVAGFAAAS